MSPQFPGGPPSVPASQMVLSDEIYETTDDSNQLSRCGH